MNEVFHYFNILHCNSLLKTDLGLNSEIKAVCQRKCVLISVPSILYFMSFSSALKLANKLNGLQSHDMNRHFIIFFFHIGKHEEKQEEGGIVTKNFTKKIQ